jgi:hypothetical protein
MAEGANLHSGPTPKTAAARLRELLARDNQITVCPGVYDGLTARIALREGFECLYMVKPLQSLGFQSSDPIADWRWHSRIAAWNA